MIHLPKKELKKAYSIYHDENHASPMEYKNASVRNVR